jgi:S-DNA-T family DNA segregation ATPase FtsK/SpoIIIE
VILAVGIFVVTGSAFTLAFAALGPATAIAGYFDSRWSARKLRRRETTRFAIDRDRVGDEIERRHADERTRLFDASPDPARLVTHEGPDPHRWRGDGRSPILVVVGTASIPSMLPVDAPAARISGTPSDADRAIADLVDRARVLERAPMTVDARLGIGVTGPPAFARAIARGIAVQLARRLSPSHCWRSASSAPYDLWLDDLPHEAAAASLPGSVVEFGQKGEAVPLAIVAVAESPAHLPGACSIVLGVVDGQLRILSHPDADDRRPLHPLPVTEIEAAEWALRLSRDAAREGMTSPHALLPDAVELTPLLRPAEAGDVASLACEPGVDAGGSVTLDLVANGPHAVIGGTTGSGKSELLIAWILAMAASRSPQHVSFLLIDYKGGATFAALARLPHTVGIITDLDAMMAARALDSLRAEVRHRERLLVTSGARSIEQVDSLPRLVIVVDEFAAMLAEHPDLHGLFADLAARGRSLGMHLVLCTQRPAGAVRDGVLANADLRVSLRVNNRADSSAVVGCDDAAGIPLTARGRGVLRLAGEAPRSVQFALASGSDVALVTQRWSQSPSPRRPWCEPLPAVLKAAALPREGIGCFGLVDLPSEQRQEPAIHSPEAEGALLVLGSPASGKSTALRALAAGHPGIRVVPAEPDGAWDVIADLVAALDSPASTATCVVLDDLDALVPRFTGEYRAAFVDLLARVLREGPGRGITALLSAQRITGESQGLATLVPGAAPAAPSLPPGLRDSRGRGWPVRRGPSRRARTVAWSVDAGGGRPAAPAGDRADCRAATGPAARASHRDEPGCTIVGQVAVGNCAFRRWTRTPIAGSSRRDYRRRSRRVAVTMGSGSGSADPGRHRARRMHPRRLPRDHEVSAAAPAPCAGSVLATQRGRIGTPSAPRPADPRLNGTPRLRGSRRARCA